MLGCAACGHDDGYTINGNYECPRCGSITYDHGSYDCPIESRHEMEDRLRDFDRRNPHD